MPSIYLINPDAASPGYYTGEAFRDEQLGWAIVADLAIATVAALVPSHWDVRLADEAIEPADLDAPETFIGITGKVTQRDRMIELAAAYRARGKTVLIGGPFASLNAEFMAPHADVLITGEIEDLAPRLFAELESGAFASRYHGGNADIRKAPVPRWDLYPVGRALSGAVQTTRGCPFNCEFCDVIQYQGRKQRHKDTHQVLAELDALYQAGFRNIFLVDDNFTVHRSFARDILAALAAWNAAQAEPVRFSTQASLDIARDGEMLDLCYAAGLRVLFVGLETVNEASLRETGKKQNLLMPMLEAVDRIVSRGISIRAGIIVGFDHDDAGIFSTLQEFFDASPLPNLNIGVLTAPTATDLHRRLRAEGRLVGEGSGAFGASLFETNIVPKLMSRSELFSGALRLALQSYAPDRFQLRMLCLIDRFPDHAPEARAAASGVARPRGNLFSVISRVSGGDPAVTAMVRTVLKAAMAKPAVLQTVIDSLAFYAQALHLLNTETALRPVEAAVA